MSRKDLIRQVVDIDMKHFEQTVNYLYYTLEEGSKLFVQLSDCLYGWFTSSYSDDSIKEMDHFRQIMFPDNPLPRLIYIARQMHFQHEHISNSPLYENQMRSSTDMYTLERIENTRREVLRIFNMHINSKSLSIVPKEKTLLDGSKKWGVELHYNTDDGNGTGTFSSSITNLSASSTYYVRAYAQNEAGTVYGNEKSFTTLSAPPPTGPCNITSTTDNVNGWYFLQSPTVSIYYSGDTYTIEMSSPNNYHFSPSYIVWICLNEQLIEYISSSSGFSSYYDSNGLLIYAQDYIIPTGLTPSNCYTIRVLKAPDTWISNPFTILP